MSFQGFWGTPETGFQILSQNSLIKILTSQLKMAGSYHGSILKAEVKWQMKSFSVSLNETCNFWEMKKKQFWLQWH